MDEPPQDPRGDGQPSDPLANIPLFGDLAKALAGQGPLNWDAARQFAHLAAHDDTSGGADANVDPKARIALEQLVGIAARHVDALLSRTVAVDQGLETVTRSVWAQRTLEAYRPLFTDLAAALGTPAANTLDTADPMVAMLGGLSQLMNPSLFGMAIGSMVGRMAKRALGQHDLPIPRPGSKVVVVPANIDALASSAHLVPDELRLWVVSQELIAGHVFAQGTVAADLTALVRRHAAAFRPDPSALADHLSTLDHDGDPLEAMRAAMSDPAVVLGAVQSDEQRALAPRLSAAFDTVVGVVDYLVDSVALRLIGGNAIDVAAAMRDRRAAHAQDNVYLERLLGLSVTTDRVQRGKEFIGAVVDRVGEDRLVSLLAAASALPTPAEFDAPGLWVARLEL